MVKKHYKNGLMLGVFLLAMFFLGRSIGAIAFGLHLQREMSIRETAGSALENTQALLSAENWGLGFGTEGTQPSGTASSDKLKEYNAYYVGDAGEKKIYLTFDCGYENGNTSQILDALKKHDAPATFFVVGHFLESAPEMVKRMVEEGHTVGNHTYHHYDMSKISDPAVFQKEMDDVRTLFRRPPARKWPCITDLLRENTVRPICRWQKIWGIPPFSGVWLMWTGMWMPSQATRKLFPN